MTPTQHQPGDHVLVEAEVLEVTSQGRLLVCFGADVIGRKEAHRCVDTVDVRPIPAAPAPDTGGWAAREQYIAQALASDAADRYGSPPWEDLPGQDRLEYRRTARIAMQADYAHGEREEAARTAPAPHAFVAWNYGDDLDRCKVCARLREYGLHGTAPAPVDDERVERAAQAAYEAYRADQDWDDITRAVLAADDAHRAGITPAPTVTTMASAVTAAVMDHPDLTGDPLPPGTRLRVHSTAPNGDGITIVLDLDRRDWLTPARVLKDLDADRAGEGA